MQWGCRLGWLSTHGTDTHDASWGANVAEAHRDLEGNIAEVS